MTIAELRAVLAGADDDRQVLVLVDDQSHREAAAEIDADGDLIITALPWSVQAGGT